MTELLFAAASAAWLGFLCAISPCPLATNIAAISFVSRKVGKVGIVLSAGTLYTLGRMLTYTALGVLLVTGLTAAPSLSYVLQKYMNLLMGPLLIVVGMVLLHLLQLPTLGHSGGTCLQKRVERMGVWGALLLGILFSLSFCPTSAALFFGSLLPLAVKMQSGVILPSVFGITTGLLVLAFAFLLAFSANRVGAAYHKLAKIEVWAQRITGVIFLLVGIGMTVKLTIGVSLW